MLPTMPTYVELIRMCLWSVTELLQVLVMRGTGEIFADYEKYLKR